MLYYKDDANLQECKFCGESRYMVRGDGESRLKEVAIKSMHYLPLIPRLKRLFASSISVAHMRWHYKNRRADDVICHLSDGEAWKHFD